MSDLDYSGKRVLITGGSGDIGRALAAAFARRGARVAFSWYMNADGANATHAAVEAAGGRAIGIRCNLGDKGAEDTLAATALAELGGLDVLISNAATGVLRPALELNLRLMSRIFDINARSLLALVQALAPALQPGARVLALTSAGGTRAIEGYAAVGASKAALESLVRHLAMELGPRGVTINAISPGVVDTGALAHFPNREQLLEVAALRTPNGRIATPEDVAQVALLLASPLAAMIQGQTIAVDGGYSVLA